MDDHQDHDMVMPGFRFHPTEEELVEFYLRRMVEGKRFNVELITSLDLYRHDPWELPALAVIGEKEWFFYVPRDRKYRNGDRPNRVTTSGYWKATGADRTIRSENFRSIGLKKTLVFYTGKAPKGIRTSWMMNEYRLPQHETQRLQKAEISLCRVYKRAGVEDHSSLSLPPSLPTKASSSKGTQSDNKHRDSTQLQTQTLESFQDFGGQISEKIETQTMSDQTMEVNRVLLSQYSSSFTGSFFVPPPTRVDDLHRLINYEQEASMQINYQMGHDLHSQFSTNLQPQSESMVASNLVLGSFQADFGERPWEYWNSISEANHDCTSPFK